MFVFVGLVPGRTNMPAVENLKWKKMLPKRRHSIQTVTDDSPKCPLKVGGGGGADQTNCDDEQKRRPIVSRRPSLAESIQYMTKSVSK